MNNLLWIIVGSVLMTAIAAVGAGAPHNRIGQRVMIDFSIYNRPPGDNSLADIDYIGHGRDGGYAEYMTAPAENAHTVNTTMSDAELATFCCAYLTGEHMLERTRVKSGERVLITGAAGGVGSGIVQLCRARGAIPYAISSRGKDALLRDLGAAGVIARQDFQRDNGAVDEAAFLTQVEMITGGEPIDVVADLVGGDLFNGLLRALRPEGRYATAGTIGGAVVQLDTRTLYLKHLQLHGSSQGTRDNFKRLVRYIEAGKIKAVLHGTYKLSDFHRAQRDFMAKNYVGKLVVVPDRKWETAGKPYAA